MHPKPKLMLVLTEDWFFLSHFVERAKAAVMAGFEVVVVSHFNEDTTRPIFEGMTLENWPLKRGSLNPYHQIKCIFALRRAIKRHQPSCIHSVGLLPILLSGLASHMCQTRPQVFAPVGLGYIFTADTLKAKILRPSIALLMKLATAHKQSFTIFENRDDREKWLSMRLAKADKTIVIPGAGVDVDAFAPKENRVPALGFIMVSRLVWEKGVGTCVEAAKLAKAKGKPWAFTLVGASDPHNHGAVPHATLQGWHDEGAINWLGKRRDVPELLNESLAYVLPSAYGEGLPKSILEAMACGLPVITTDTPGCREAITHEENGLLIPAKNPEALFAAMERLAETPDLRQQLGAKARQDAVERFSTLQVNEATVEVWQNSLKQD